MTSHRTALTFTLAALLLTGCAPPPDATPSPDPCTATRTAADMTAADMKNARASLRTYLTFNGYAPDTISDDDLSAGKYTGRGLAAVQDKEAEWVSRTGVFLHVIADNPTCFDAVTVATARAKLDERQN